MQLLDTDIRKFQELYKTRFGMDISREEAVQKGGQLLRLMELVYRPMTEEEHAAIQKHRHNTFPLLANKLLNHESTITYDPRTIGKN